jgi:hypothetical protein
LLKEITIKGEKMDNRGQLVQIFEPSHPLQGLFGVIKEETENFFRIRPMWSMSEDMHFEKIVYFQNQDDVWIPDIYCHSVCIDRLIEESIENVYTGTKLDYPESWRK